MNIQKIMLFYDYNCKFQVGHTDNSDVIDAFFFLIYSGPDWHFYERLTFLIDGETFVVDSSQNDRKVIRANKVVENVYFKIDSDILEKLSKASTIKVRASSSKFNADLELVSKHKIALKQLYKLSSSKEAFQQMVSKF
tara:strand:+ start:172 stop:585 length:414 start_codon:yes stop_codon:yes gene_type:complete